LIGAHSAHPLEVKNSYQIDGSESIYGRRRFVTAEECIFTRP
jgi:hypothetical protein